MKKFSVILLFTLYFLSACGQTGPLYLPEEKAEESSANEQAKKQKPQPTTKDNTTD